MALCIASASFSMSAYRCSRLVSFWLMKKMGHLPSGVSWDSTAPKPTSEVSVYMKKEQLGRGLCNRGCKHRAHFTYWNMAWTSGFHWVLPSRVTLLGLGWWDGSASCAFPESSPMGSFLVRVALPLAIVWGSASHCLPLQGCQSLGHHNPHKRKCTSGNAERNGNRCNQVRHSRKLPSLLSSKSYPE